MHRMMLGRARLSAAQLPLDWIFRTFVATLAPCRLISRADISCRAIFDTRKSMPIHGQHARLGRAAIADISVEG